MMQQLSLLFLPLMTLVTGVAQANDCAGSSHLAIAAAPKASASSQSCEPQQQTYISAASYDVVCDGVVDDSPGAQKALNAASAHGGAVVVFPATGAACRLSTGLTVPSGVSIEGTAGLNWPGPFSNVESQWTNKGTWFRCEDRKNPCVLIGGVGSHVSGVNFWYTQPTPEAGSFCGVPCKYTRNWKPIIYPYTIEISTQANFNHLSDISIVNATHCINWEGPSSGVAGIYSYMRDLSLGCFNRGIRFSKIDTTIYASNIRHDIWWYRGNSDVLEYTEGEGQRIDWEVEYLANLQADGIEFVNSAVAIKFADGTVKSGFGTVSFAANELQLDNVSFNEVCQAMAVASPTTHVSGHLTNVIAYADTITSDAKQCAGAKTRLFDLSSDNVYVRMNNLSVGFAQNVATVGGGTSGYLGLSGTHVQRYSAFAAGGIALVAAPGAQIAIDDNDSAIFEVRRGLVRLSRVGGSRQ